MIYKLAETLFFLITYTGNIDPDIYHMMWILSSVALVISLIGLPVFVYLHPNLRQRKRTEDRFLFWECVLVYGLIVSDGLTRIIVRYFDSIRWIGYCLMTVSELCYMLAVVQWLVFVDYSLYRSMDHVRRRYKHAAVPVFVLMGLDIVQSILIFVIGYEKMLMFAAILQVSKLLMELLYIISAIHLVITYSKESREPRFIHLDAFIVPFLLGLLFRFFDESFLALGVVLTYRAVKRRDRFIDPDTGFFNKEFLEYRGKYRDKKKYSGGEGILISAAGHGREMVDIISEFKPADLCVVTLGEGRFLFITEAIKKSAVKMTVMTITEAAETSDDPFTPKIITVERGSNESASDFAARIINTGI